MLRKKYMMGVECSTHGRSKKLIPNLCRHRIILKLLLGKQIVRVWTGYMWLRTGTGEGLVTTVIDLRGSFFKVSFCRKSLLRAVK
jgi:hypothetical protein